MVGGGVRRRRRELGPLLVHLAGWTLVVALLGWLLLAGFYGLVAA